MRNFSAEVNSGTRVVEVITVDLTRCDPVDPMSNVELILITPDGRSHKVAAKTEWFIYPNYEDLR